METSEEFLNTYPPMHHFQNPDAPDPNLLYSQDVDAPDYQNPAADPQNPPAHPNPPLNLPANHLFLAPAVPQTFAYPLLMPLRYSYQQYYPTDEAPPPEERLEYYDPLQHPLHQQHPLLQPPVQPLQYTVPMLHFPQHDEHYFSYTRRPLNRKAASATRLLFSTSRSLLLNYPLSKSPGYITPSARSLVLLVAMPGLVPHNYMVKHERMMTGAPRRFKIVRGIAGGLVTRPPELGTSLGKEYLHVDLNVFNALIEEINRVPWSYAERSDGRRIVRVECTQHEHVVNALFSVVGLALEHPEPAAAPPHTEVVEVSCLNYTLADSNDQETDYSITLVEVVNIIEALIGTKEKELILRRREKGRIRLNLMPFWLKKPLPSKKTAMTSDYADSRLDFARRIMDYEIRKPRGFDKDVRILPWDKLVAALHRALLCYFAEMPQDDGYLV